MTSLKIGDKIRVANLKDTGYKLTVTNIHKIYSGNTGTVIACSGECGIRLSVDNGLLYWSDDMVSLVEDIQVGDLVKIRSDIKIGRDYVVRRMMQYAGKVARVTSITHNYTYNLDVSKVKLEWSPNSFIKLNKTAKFNIGEKVMHTVSNKILTIDRHSHDGAYHFKDLFGYLPESAVVSLDEYERTKPSTKHKVDVRALKLDIDFIKGTITRVSSYYKGKLYSAVAMLHPDDEFDYKIGIGLAIERLLSDIDNDIPEENVYGHIYGTGFGEFGKVGTALSVNDIVGEQLHVGDVVALTGVKTGKVLNRYVLGNETGHTIGESVDCENLKLGIVENSFEKFTVKKVISYTEIKSGETHGNYVYKLDK